MRLAPLLLPRLAREVAGLHCCRHTLLQACIVAWTQEDKEIIQELQQPYVPLRIGKHKQIY